jgi:hypothetical protein
MPEYEKSEALCLKAAEEKNAERELKNEKGLDHEGYPSITR